MEKQNRVAYIADMVGSISFILMVVYTFICVLVVISMIAEGDGEEVLMSLPWMIGVLVGGLLESGLCFVIGEIVQLLDDCSRFLFEGVKLLRKGSNDNPNTDKLYDEKLPEL